MPSKTILSTLMILTTLAGCGSDESRTQTYPVSGTIAREGKPAADVLVRFHPAKPSPELTTLTTRTDTSGHYSLSTYLANDGAPAGDYVVSVLLNLPPEVDEGGDTESSLKTRPIPLPTHLVPFTNPTTSPLRASVKPDDNTFDFDLR